MVREKGDAVKSIVSTMVEFGITPASLVGPYEAALYRASKRKAGTLYSCDDICRQLKISRATLYRYVKAGLPYHHKEESRNKRWYSVPECVSFIKQYKKVKKKGAKK